MSFIKKYFIPTILSLLLIGLFSCEEDTEEKTDDTEIVGNWNLIQAYTDPGDGSGTFKAVDSSKKLVILSDGTFTSNYSMCVMNAETDETGSGTYNQTDSLMYPVGCDYKLWFYMTQSGHLEVHYPCIEGCGERYEKVE
ncbi:MAG: hypothetical protein ABJ004_14755 [Cyclobacteriaceae bacterium]